MVDESPETRISRLEQEMARTQQLLATHDTDIRAFAGSAVAIAELRITLSHLQAEVLETRKENAEQGAELKVQIRALTEALRERDQQATEERRAQRNAVYALLGVIVAAIIGAVGTILAAGGI